MPAATSRGDGAQGEPAHSRASAGDALALGARPSVVNVELGQPLRLPDQKVERAARRPRSSLRRVPGRRHRSGEGVLVGLIDVGGFDFTHPDFLDGQGGTRFERIWDQGGQTRPSPKAAGRATSTTRLGARKDELDRALAAAGSAGLPAYELEPQSQMSRAHATHVASIAAGNRGVARKARIAGVLISIPDDEAERRLSFYDSSRLAHAVDYLLEAAGELGDSRCRSTSASARTAMRTTIPVPSAAGSTPPSPARTQRLRGGGQRGPRARRGRPGHRLHHGPRPRERTDSRPRGSRRISSGTWWATASSISPRTSSRSGTARRTASPFR